MLIIGIQGLVRSQIPQTEEKDQCQTDRYIKQKDRVRVLPGLGQPKIVDAVSEGIFRIEVNRQAFTDVQVTGSAAVICSPLKGKSIVVVIAASSGVSNCGDESSHSLLSLPQTRIPPGEILCQYGPQYTYPKHSGEPYCIIPRSVSARLPRRRINFSVEHISL